MLRFFSSVILRRLLPVEVFGIMAIVRPFITGLHMFSDIGLGPSIIQNERGEERSFLDTAWTLQVIRGFILFSITFVLAWPVARFYENRILMFILPGIGFATFLTGFNSTKIFTKKRNMELAGVTLLEIGAQVFAILVMVFYALKWKNVWALVAGEVAWGLALAAGSHLFLKGQGNRFAWEKESLRELIHFGKWVFLSSIITFFANQSDRLVFGKTEVLKVVGIYSLAYQLSQMPTLAILKLGEAVGFPAYSEKARQGGDFEKVYWRFRMPLIALGGMSATGLLLAGPPLVEALFGAKYLEARWMLQILSIGVWFQIMECTNGSALLALGSPKWIAFANAAKFLGILALLPLGYHLAGFQGALWGLAASDVLRHLASMAGVIKKGIRVILWDLVLTAFFGFIAGAGFLLSMGIRENGHVLRIIVLGIFACLPWGIFGIASYKKPKS